MDTIEIHFKNKAQAYAFEHGVLNNYVKHGIITFVPIDFAHSQSFRITIVEKTMVVNDKDAESEMVLPTAMCLGYDLGQRTISMQQHIKSIGQ